MADFAKGLGAAVNIAAGMPVGTARPRVIDKTGLAGVYEFRLEFEGTLPVLRTPPAVAPEAVPEASDPGGPDLFKALEKQLGLKLVKGKSVPVDVLVIDHADRVPTEN